MVKEVKTSLNLLSFYLDILRIQAEKYPAAIVNGTFMNTALFKSSKGLEEKFLYIEKWSKLPSVRSSFFISFFFSSSSSLSFLLEYSPDISPYNWGDAYPPKTTNDPFINPNSCSPPFLLTTRIGRTTAASNSELFTSIPRQGKRKAGVSTSLIPKSFLYLQSPVTDPVILYTSS